MQLQTEPGTGVHVDEPVARRAASEEEFAAYMDARRQGLLRTAYLLTGDRHTAEDLVQTALAKLYLSWDKVHRREAVDGYVRRILVHEHTSLWRRAWKRREVSTDRVPDAPDRASRESPDVDVDVSEALWAVVRSLPRRQRAVVVLRYYEELSEAETAQTLGVSVGTVKSQASRAMDTLRRRVLDEPRLAPSEEDR